MKCLGIIPARYGSTRFPGKPLIDIAGKTMIQRVLERASTVDAMTTVVVATDDPRIVDHVTEIGGLAMLTSAAHHSGTDRCNEVVSKLNESYDVVVNIQGDEPFVHPEQLTQLIQLFKDETVQIATLVRESTDQEEIQNSNRVKVVCNAAGDAIYFSRSPVPFQRNPGHHTSKIHLGLYGYRPETLAQITDLAPSALELTESLEQLRWLENGFPIRAGITAYDTVTIDTPKDLENILKELEKGS